MLLLKSGWPWRQIEPFQMTALQVPARHVSIVQNYDLYSTSLSTLISVNTFYNLTLT